jgi:hypothetical protein
MPIPTVTATRMIELDYTRPVSFRVEVGNDMPGGTTWHCLSQAGECKGEEVSLTDLENLKFSTLFLTTTIEDNNPATNHTSVTYLVRNGGAVHSFPFSFTLPDKSRFVAYLIDFTFI